MHQSTDEVKVKAAHLYLTLCDPLDYTSPWNSFLQGIFPTQGSNPGLPHCRRIHYQLNHKGNPRILGWVACPFSSASSRPRNRTTVSCIAGRFFTIWATKEAQEYWSGWPIPSPGDLPNPGIEPRSPALQVVSLPAELTEKPRKRLYPKTKTDIPICLEYFFP